jgi:hypothetical protein
MKVGIAFSLFIAALASFPVLSRADDGVRWESLHVYTLPGGRPVAVAVPAEWLHIGQDPVVVSKLRFVAPSGTKISIPLAALERASSEQRVFRPLVAGSVALAAQARD